MVSQKKLDANRRNAAKSTGPKSDDGKAKSSQNALTHGLTSSKYPILPGEDEAAYLQFHAAMTKDLKPAGVMQREIVDDLVQVRWRIRRVPQIEAEMFCEKRRREIQNHQQYDQQVPPLDLRKLLREEFHWGSGGSYANLELYRQRLQRSMHTLLRELRKLRDDQMDVEEEQLDLLPRDTGLRPVQSEVESAENAALQIEQHQHGPEARVTGESATVESASGKNEPTDCDNPQAERVLDEARTDALARSVEQSLQQVVRLDEKMSFFRRMLGE